MAKKDPKTLPQTVIILGMVSLLTDFSSEMIYPLLPLFLSQTLGAGALALGVIEGLAETIASLLKLVSGRWSDQLGKRRPFLLWGYGLAGAVRPLIALATSWPGVLLIRSVDRVGKGLRSAPRDALIADTTPIPIRGAAYGFHRSMDHAGAVIGPVFAAFLLAPSFFSSGLPLRTVFAIAAIPALAAFGVLWFALKEPPSQAHPVKSKSGIFVKGILEDWHLMGKPFQVLLTAVLIFTLGNSTDAFILLKLSEAGVPAAWIALLWAAHHIVKMTSNYWGGRLSDRIGHRTLVLFGWVYYGFIYLLFSIFEDRVLLIATFLAYGAFYGLTEPSEKALVASTVPAEKRATAFGFFNLAQGLGALPASLLFGLIWYKLGSAVAFSVGALLAILAATLLGLANKNSLSGKIK